MPSSSLVPHDDPTLLFTNAGMNQFKDMFLGRERRDYKRATTAQKCMRVSGKHNDLDNVGPSLRHHTFFEMLGNFSFGDYFKERGDRVRLDRAHRGVEAAEGPAARVDLRRRRQRAARRRGFQIWRKYLPADRIDEFGAADNFWQMGDTGPCGRCSEISLRSSRRPRRARERSAGRGVEQRLHGVQPPGRRRARAAAGAVDRHRHGPRAHHRGHPGQVLELRHRPLPADPRRHRRPRRPRATGRTPRPTSRCGSIADHLRADRRSSSPTASCRRTSGAATCCARSCGARCVTASGSACAIRSCTGSSTRSSPRWARPIPSWSPTARRWSRSCAARKSASTRC